MTTSENIELSIIGMLMSDKPKQLREHLGMVRKQDFVNPIYAEIYEVITVLFNRGIIPDAMSIVNEYKKNGRQAPVQLISKAISSAPTYEHQNEQTIAHLWNYAKQKNIDNFLKNTQRKILDGSLNVERFLTDTNNLIDFIQKYEVEIEETNEDVIDQVIDKHNRTKAGEKAGETIGHGNLQEDVILEPVDFMVIGARPAMGKTTFAVSSIVNLVFHEKKNIAFFCVEMSKKQIMTKILANLASVDTKKIKLGKCTDEQIKSIEAQKNRPEWKNLHIYTGEHTVSQISSKVSKLHHDRKIDQVWIDYLQKLESNLPSSSSETSQVKQISNDCKKVAQHLGIPIIALSQLSRSVQQRGGDRRPVLADLKQTGDIEQDASIVAFLHRPEYYGQTEMPGKDKRSSKGVAEFIIAKNREGELNIREFKFEPWYSKFSSSYAGYTATLSGENKEENDDDLPF